MAVQLLGLTLLLTLASIVQGTQQTKPTIIVDTFVMANGVIWPYDMNQIKLETLGELIEKDGQSFFVLAEPLKDCLLYTSRCV